MKRRKQKSTLSIEMDKARHKYAQDLSRRTGSKAKDIEQGVNDLIEESSRAIMKSSKVQRGRKAGTIYFPRHPLKKALQVAQAIWNDNGGSPYSRLSLASSLDLSPTSSSFAILLASSFRYGLTEGSYVSEKISLTQLGNSIVAPTASTNVDSSLRSSLLNPPIFNTIYTNFDQKPIPREEVFKNTLQIEYKLPKEDVQTCYNVIMANIFDYGIMQEIKGVKYLRLDLLSPPTQSETTEDTSTLLQEPITEFAPSTVEGVTFETSGEKSPRVFISHSKNRTILNQIKEMLDFGSFDFEIAEERETTAIPIPEKIFGLMEKCDCAIINLSADEERKLQDETYGLNENVLIEIGAAYLHYDRRVILLIDNRLTDKLPSNIKGLAAIYYEGDELSWNAGTKLQKALTEFRSSL